jgi:hypothetical protein
MLACQKGTVVKAKTNVLPLRPQGAGPGEEWQGTQQLRRVNWGPSLCCYNVIKKEQMHVSGALVPLLCALHLSSRPYPAP